MLLVMNISFIPRKTHGRKSASVEGSKRVVYKLFNQEMQIMSSVVHRNATKIRGRFGQEKEDAPIGAKEKMGKWE